VSTFRQTSSGDLALENGTLVLEREPSAVAAITLRNKFLRGRGSWFLATDEGIPYVTRIWGKGRDLGVARKIFEKVILSVPQVSDLEELNVSLRTADRVLLVSFRAKCSDGKTIVGGLGDSFVVEVL